METRVIHLVVGPALNQPTGVGHQFGIVTQFAGRIVLVYSRPDRTRGSATFGADKLAV